MAASDGTTSRNSRPDAASASHAASTIATIAIRSTQHWRVGAAAVAGARALSPRGRSHRSSRSVTSKNTMLARITKQIAA